MKSRIFALLAAVAVTLSAPVFAQKSAGEHVEARGGIVQLGGFVTSKAMRDRAMAVAKGVPGVQRVDDAMFVKPE